MRNATARGLSSARLRRDGGTVAMPVRRLVKRHVGEEARGRARVRSLQQHCSSSSRRAQGSSEPQLARAGTRGGCRAAEAASMKGLGSSLQSVVRTAARQRRRARPPASRATSGVEVTADGAARHRRSAAPATWRRRRAPSPTHGGVVERSAVGLVQALVPVADLQVARGRPCRRRSSASRTCTSPTRSSRARRSRR